MLFRSGLADPRALTLAIAAKESVHFLGVPEGALALAEAAVYLATAPRSNALYRAYGEAVDDIRLGKNPPVPYAIRNAVTGLMANQGFGKGYQYAHDLDEAVAGMQCLPDELAARRYYRPTARGFEKTLGERLTLIDEMKQRSRGGPKGGSSQ